jgi:hypothetical protein
MNSLALEYCLLRRHEDALLLQEKVLEVRRRILPLDHPDIGDISACCLTSRVTEMVTRGFEMIQTKPCTTLQRRTLNLGGNRKRGY